MSSLNDKLIQSTNDMFYDCLTRSKFDEPIPKLNILDKIYNLFNYITSSCIKRRDANARDANARDANARDANAIDANAIDANAIDANNNDIKYKHEKKIVKDYEGNILEYISFT